MLFIRNAELHVLFHIFVLAQVVIESTCKSVKMQISVICEGKIKITNAKNIYFFAN